jgi:hypothetical protein
MAQHYFHAAKPDHAEEVLSMKFVADNQPAEFFCAVICTKSQAQSNLSYLSDRF